MKRQCLCLQRSPSVSLQRLGGGAGRGGGRGGGCVSVTAVLGKGKGKLPAAGDGGPPVSPERGGCSPATEGDE